MFLFLPLRSQEIISTLLPFTFIMIVLLPLFETPAEMDIVPVGHKGLSRSCVAPF